MMNLEEKMETLKDYFSKETSVVMAYVFGSYAKERVMSESDFDIAVYFRPEGREIEYEKDGEYPDEDRVWDDVRKIVGVNTDFVVMNRCPSTLALDILESGKEIIVKDDSLRLEFYLITSSVAEDFMEFASDFHAIRQRSASLSKVDKHNLMRRKVFLENEIKDIDHFKDLDFNTYKTDKNKRRIVERWIEVIVTASIDIAKIVLASEKKDIPRTYNDTLEVLGFMIGLDEQASKKFSKFAELRNIIAHEYLDTLYARVKKFIDEAEPLYKELIDFVGKILEK
ncbi:MAG: hypothetical protein COZ15_05005 [Elusimicrobia bacterium CG_4_10_14_3_um_filter_49_12_50_7]|nr:MAG: hypothetical protein COZ15_05005 [Elusimicrobia bacterium CG_4_10_14_3_um_filter_49_12_50_7]